MKYKISKNNFMLVWIMLLFPVVLFSNLFMLHSEDFKNFLKLLVFFSMIWFVPVLGIFKQVSWLQIAILLFSLHIIAITIYYQRPLEDFFYALLFVFPFFIFLRRKKIDFFHYNKILPVYLLITFAILTYVIVHPHEIVGGKSVFAPVLFGPHTSSYSSVLLYFFFFYCWTNKKISNLMIIVLSLMFFFLIFGYKARNTELGLLLFLLTYFFGKSRFSHELKYVILFVLLIFSIAGIWVVNGFFSPDWNEVSSGRLAVWTERIGILRNYDFGTLLFGQGYGADIMKTKQWWWEAKASHNDFISLVFNGGLVALVLFVVIYFYLFKSANSFQKALLVFLAVTSVTNTGLLGRPIQFLFFCFLYAMGSMYVNNSRQVQ